jgi:hypothetical protein
MFSLHYTVYCNPRSQIIGRLVVEYSSSLPSKRDVHSSAPKPDHGRHDRPNMVTM